MTTIFRSLLINIATTSSCKNLDLVAIIAQRKSISSQFQTSRALIPYFSIKDENNVNTDSTTSRFEATADKRFKASGVRKEMLEWRL
jgi:hypothetical protein